MEKQKERWLSGPKQQVANLCPSKSGPWVRIPPSPQTDIVDIGDI